MSSANLGLIIEILVAMLLITTIAYCAILNSRLKNLRADEHILKATISELLAATEIAERAIIGLKATTREAEAALTQKLRDAQILRNEFQQQAPVTPRPAPQHQQSAPLERMQEVAPQQVSTALRAFEHELGDAPVRPTPQEPRDFRMFTRSSFSSRSGSVK
jgi:hypothetical protein